MIFCRYITNILSVHLLQFYSAPPLSNVWLRYWVHLIFISCGEIGLVLLKISSTSGLRTQISIYLKYHAGLASVTIFALAFTIFLVYTSKVLKYLKKHLLSFVTAFINMYILTCTLPGYLRLKILHSAERDVKRDLAMHVYISYLSRYVYVENILPGRFSSRPGKAGSGFAQRGFRLKRDNFYNINTPSRFAGTILCWLWKLSLVKSSRVETFSCKPGWKASYPAVLFIWRVRWHAQARRHASTHARIHTRMEWLLRAILRTREFANINSEIGHFRLWKHGYCKSIKRAGLWEQLLK